MGSKSLESPHKDYKKVMLKDAADTWPHGDGILTRAMKLHDLFSCHFRKLSTQPEK
jgi:hypothetical protein